MPQQIGDPKNDLTSGRAVNLFWLEGFIYIRLHDVSVASATDQSTLLGLEAASFAVYAANRQTPSAKLGRVEDTIIATEKMQRHAKTNGARDQVKWMDYKRRLFEFMVIGVFNFSAQVSVSNIQTRLLEARSIKTWREYLERIREILQSIEECAQEVKQIQTSILVRVFSNAGVDD
ncbi:hypothetical protein B0H14DRAFT_3745875 [Mycena olivaceomarginata]|nr:hypothetical protein B0H14DRAFT_3745875 [Mycena olivaceomarginata]